MLTFDRFLGPRQWEVHQFGQVEPQTPKNNVTFPDVSVYTANVTYSYQTPLSLPVVNDVGKPELKSNIHLPFDPDVTQLDIDTEAIQLDTPKSQKRQLIEEAEDIKKVIWSQIRINCDEDEFECLRQQQ